MFYFILYLQLVHLLNGCYLDHSNRPSMSTWILIQNQILLLLLYYINIIYFTEFKYI